MTTAATTITEMAPRRRAMLLQLAWAYLASLHRGESFQASIFLSVFQENWNQHNTAILATQPDAVRTNLNLRVLGRTSRFDEWTRAALALTLYASGDTIRISSGEYQALRRMDAQQAGAFFSTALLYKAPFGDEAVWGVYDWGHEVDPGAMGAYVDRKIDAFIDGSAAGMAQQTPAPLPRREAPDLVPDPSPHDAEVVEGPEFSITAIPRSRTLMSYWPWAVAGLGALTLAGVLLLRKGKKGRRR